MHSIKLLAALSGAIALSACATTEPGDLSLTETAPEAWTAVELNAPPTGDWVADFNDQILSSLISEALENNYDLAAAEARLEQAAALRRQANANRLPTLDGSVDSTTTSSVDPTGDRSDNTVFGLGLSARWEADVWGRLSDARKAAAFDEQATLADFEGARLSIAGTVSRSWFELIEARLQTDLARRDVENRERSLRFIERRYQRGLSTSLDVRLSRSALASSRAALASRIQAEEASSRALEVVLSRYPAAELRAAEALPVLEPLAGVGAPAELLARRPDLKAAEYRLESAGLRASQARKALLPSLSLSGSASTGGTDLEDILDVDDALARLVASVAQPIFRGGALRAEAVRQEAVARERLASYSRSVLGAWQEAENALEADIRLAEREAALDEAVEEAARAEELAERQYNNGLRTIFDLLDAQTRRINSESQLLAASRQRASNRVSLYLAIGGAFDAPVADPSGARLSVEP